MSPRHPLAAVLAMMAGLAAPASAIDFPGPDPGAAAARLEGGEFVLENAAIAVAWTAADGDFRLERVEDRIGRKQFKSGSDAFAVLLADGSRLGASSFRQAAKPELVRLEADEKSTKSSAREAGWQAVVRLASPDDRFHVVWKATLRDRSNYVRTELALSFRQSPAGLAGAIVLEFPTAEGKVAGTVSGSPASVGNLFLACEHPLAENRAEPGRSPDPSPDHLPGSGAVTPAPGSARLAAGFSLSLQTRQPQGWQPWPSTLPLSPPFPPCCRSRPGATGSGCSTWHPTMAPCRSPPARPC